MRLLGSTADLWAQIRLKRVEDFLVLISKSRKKKKDTKQNCGVTRIFQK